MGLLAGVVLSLILLLAVGGVGYVVFLAADGSLPRSLDLIDLISRVVTTIAVVVGGAWVLFRYVVFQTGATNLQMSLESEVLPYSADLRIVAVSVKLKNAGQVKIIAGSAGCTFSVWRLPKNLPAGSTISIDSGEILLADVDLLAKYDQRFKYEIEPGAEYHEMGGIIAAKGEVLGAGITFHFGSREEEDAITEYILIRVDDRSGQSTASQHKIAPRVIPRGNGTGLQS